MRLGKGRECNITERDKGVWLPFCLKKVCSHAAGCEAITEGGTNIACIPL